MKLGNSCTNTEIPRLLPQIMYKSWHFKIVKLGQNLYANMEAFWFFAELVTYVYTLTR